MNKKIFHQIFTSSLGRRLFLATLLFSSLITLLITAIQLYDDYKNEISLIEQQFDQIKRSHLESIAQSTWVVDGIQIDKQLEGLTKLPYIEFAQIRVDENQFWAQGPLDIENVISTEFGLTYKHRGNEVLIGTLTVRGSLNQVYVKLIDRVVFLLAANAIKTFLVAVFVLFVFYQLLGKHIAKLAGSAENFLVDQNLPLFELDRKNTRNIDESDELDSLTRSLNRMMTTLKDREEKLKVFSVAIDQSPNAIVLTDTNGRIEYTNKHFTDTSGYTYQEAKGKNPSFLSSGHTPKELYQELWTTISNGKVWTGDLQNKTKEGQFFWESTQIAPIFNADGDIAHYLAIKEDITIRKSYEAQLLRQANFDSLTNLPNRILAFDRIAQALINHNRDRGHVVIMVVDLDHFKNINDTLGHDTGDEILVQSAQRLKHSVRVEDTIARLGGDEFLVILSNVTGEKVVDSIAEKIIKTFQKPLQTEGRDIYITASIGVTLYPEDGEDPQALLKNADAAMYRAKAEGRNNFCYFTKAMNDQAKARFEIEHELRGALANHEFELHFQPIVSADDQHPVAMEALLRWHNDKLGNVSPDTFIKLAEDIGIIVPIGEWVLENACMTAANWSIKYSRPIRVAVNVSVRQFKAGNLLQTVDHALKHSGLAANKLEIEVTEGLLLEDNLEVQDILNQLHSRGVRLSIDDFGTGYSALSYLNKFPFDILKIDRSFVHDLEQNTEAANLIMAIISMAHTLNMPVIGEGIETEQQYAFLRDHNIDLIQGYFFSRPLTFSQFENYMDKQYSPSALQHSDEVGIKL